MRIVHVITRFIPGGADENTQITCNHQAAAGHEVTLIVGAEWSPLMRERLDERVRFVVLPSLVRPIAPAHDLAALVKLYRLFRLQKPSLVHTHTSKAGFVGRMAAMIARVPRIVHGVHILPFINVSPLAGFAYVWLERLCGWRTHAFIHVSPAMRDACLARGVGRSALHVVAESGMDIARFRSAPVPEDVAKLLESPVDASERPVVLLTIAALEERKGLRQLLSIFRAVVGKHPNTVLLLAGEGKDRSILQAQIAQLALERHVRLLGYRKDPERLLAIADIAIVASAREGLPRVAVQAAIAGVPLITTALPGVEIVVDEGLTGIIVPVSDAAAMEKALLTLMANPELRQTFRRNLAARDFSAWSEDRMIAHIARAYEAAC